jgi:hypothetical protein
MSISPDAPDVSEECKMEVRDFYVEQVGEQALLHCTGLQHVPASIVLLERMC